jgi:hypothetical protein
MDSLFISGLVLDLLYRIAGYCGGMIVLEHAIAAFAGTGARSLSRGRRNNKKPL